MRFNFGPLAYDLDSKKDYPPRFIEVLITSMPRTDENMQAAREYLVAAGILRPLTASASPAGTDHSAEPAGTSPDQAP